MKALVMLRLRAAAWTSFFRALIATRAQRRWPNAPRDSVRRGHAFTSFWFLHAR